MPAYVSFEFEVEGTTGGGGVGGGVGGERGLG